MIIGKLTMRNFMPYKGKQVIEFPNDEQRNVMLILGENTHGKTSIMNAIRWAFYGEVLDRQMSEISLQKLVNKESALEDDWRVEVHIEFDAHDCHYDLRRVADRRKFVATPTKPSDFDRAVYLSRDNVQVSGDQIESELESIVPKQISRFFLFDGELLREYETLLLDNHQQGSEIKKAIEQVLGVPALSNGRDSIKAIQKKATKQQSNDLKQLEGLKVQAEQHEELISTRDSIERDIEILICQLKKAEKETRKLEIEISSAQSVLKADARIQSLNQQYTSIRDDIEKKRDKVLDLKSEMWKDLLEAQLKVKREQLEQDREKIFQSIQHRLILSNKVSDLKKMMDTHECPTCNQHIDMQRRIEIGTELGEAEVELSVFEDKSDALATLSSRLSSLSKIQGIGTRDKYFEFTADIRNQEVKSIQIETEISQLNEEIEGFDTADLARKRARCNQLLKEQGGIQEDINRQQEILKDTERNLEIATQAIEGLTEARAQRSTIKVTLCNNLEKIFSLSIEKLREKLKSHVEQLANEAFMEMITQKKYKGLKINDNYGLQILDDRDQYVEITSAGAEQIVALSLIDGLNRTGRSSGPIIMDTPFGRLDKNHRKNVINYLPTVCSQFILLVHSGEVNAEEDLASIAERIGGRYQVVEINTNQSRIERIYQ